MKRIISYVLLLAIVLSASSVSLSVYAVDSRDTDRIVCQATLEDNFADDVVIVTVDKEHSEINTH